MSLSPDPPENKVGGAESVAEVGARHLKRLLLGNSKSDVLPSGREWLKVAESYAGPQDLLDAMRVDQLLPLEDLCCEALLDMRVLMAPSLLARRAQVQVAMKTAWYDGRGKFEDWVRRRVLVGLLDGLDAEMEEYRSGRPMTAADRGEFALFTELLGVSPSEGRGVMLRFAALDPPVRCLAFDIVARGRALSDVAQELELDPAAAAGEFDKALQRIGAIAGEPAPLYASWQDLLDRLLYDEEN